MLDPSAFLTSFMAEQRSLLAYLHAATGDYHAAEDLLQTVAGVLWKRLAEYDESRPFRGWAMGVARLEVLKWRQSASRSREVLSEETIELLAETAVEKAEQIDRRFDFLSECLKALGTTARRCLELKYGDGRRIAEIAEQLQRTMASVEMVLVRSRRQLRECVEHKMAHPRQEVARP